MNCPRICALIGLLALSACVSTRPPVSPDSLAAFRDTLVQLDAKAIEAMTFEYEWSYRNFKRRVQNQPDLDPRELALQFCSGPGTDTGAGSVFDASWGGCDVDSGTAPVFVVIADSRQTLGKLNQMMVDYANFLLLFNDANAATRSSLESAAGRIGESAKAIAGKFDRTFDQARFGAFAKIGVGSIEQLLARKQREGMAAVLADFQPGVAAFAGLGSEAMKNSAVGIQAEYLEDRGPLLRAIAAAAENPPGRLEQVENLIALNEQTVRQLDVLASLDGAYQSLPGAHAELISALQSGQRASLAELVMHVERIGSVYGMLHAPDSE